VSQLKKCLRVPKEVVEIEGLPLQPDLSYIEHPIKILDEKERVTRNSVVKFYKFQWQNHTEAEATWEQERYLEALSPSYSLYVKIIIYQELFFVFHTKHA
jgi:hypothetical protein